MFGKIHALGAGRGQNDAVVTHVWWSDTGQRWMLGGRLGVDHSSHTTGRKHQDLPQWRPRVDHSSHMSGRKHQDWPQWSTCSGAIRWPCGFADFLQPILKYTFQY